MKPRHILNILARHSIANKERVFISVSVVKDAEFITIYGHEVFALVNITMPQSVRDMIVNQPETTPPGKISMDELRLTACLETLQALLGDERTGPGPWRNIAQTKANQISILLDKMHGE